METASLRIGWRRFLSPELGHYTLSLKGKAHQAKPREENEFEITKFRILNGVKGRMGTDHI